MNKQPSQAELIDYLYGELPAKRKQEIEAYVASDPALQRALQEMQEARSALQQLPKQSVDPPIILAQSPKAKVVSLGWWKPMAGIAAAFALFMFAAGTAQFKMGQDQQGWYISFGQAEEAAKLSRLDSMQRHFQQDLNGQQVALQASLALQTADWEAKLQALAETVPKTNSLRIPQAQLEALLRGMREENKEMAEQLLSLVRSEQQTFVEGALIEMASQLREQRQQELLLIERALFDLQAKDEQTGIVLSQLVNYLQEGR